MVTSSNPITQWVKGVMAEQEKHDQWLFQESLVVTSILAQKFHDWRVGPQRPWGYWSQEHRSAPSIMTAAAHSTLKTVPAGRLNSLSAFNYYLDKNKTRRDELIAKYHGQHSAAQEN